MNTLKQMLIVIVVLTAIVSGSIFAFNVLMESIGIMLYIPHSFWVYASIVILILSFWTLGGMYKAWLEVW